jgi:hypothetical protein
MRRWCIGVAIGALCVGCTGSSDDDSARDTRPATTGAGPADGDVVPFSAHPVDAAPPVPPDSPWRQVALEIEAEPSSVAQGEELTCVVAVTNVGGETIDPDELCPAYYTNFGESSISAVPVISSLNCEDASPIAPGGVERFAMEIELPTDMEPGAGSIIWRLDPYIEAAFSSELVVERST